MGSPAVVATPPIAESVVNGYLGQTQTHPNPPFRSHNKFLSEMHASEPFCSSRTGTRPKIETVQCSMVQGVVTRDYSHVAG